MTWLVSRPNIQYTCALKQWGLIGLIARKSAENQFYKASLITVFLFIFGGGSVVIWLSSMTLSSAAATSSSLSTNWHIFASDSVGLKAFPHWRLVAKNGACRRIRRQSPFLVTVWTGHKSLLIDWLIWVHVWHTHKNKLCNLVSNEYYYLGGESSIACGRNV